MVEWKRLTAITGNPVDVYMDQVAFIEQYVAVDPRRAPRTGCRDHAAELRLLWNFPLKRSVGLALRSLVPIMLRYRQERSAGSHEGPEVPSATVPPPLLGHRRRAPRILIRAPRILIVEDELLIALMIEEMVRESGYRVSGTAHTLHLARQELAKRNFDAVLFDVNFDGRPRPEIADLLVERAVPFAFVTGYDYVLEPRHENVPVLQKPFTFPQLRLLLRDLVGPGSASGETAQSA